MKTQILTLAILGLTLPAFAAHAHDGEHQMSDGSKMKSHSHEGMHQMPDGTWMKNHDMDTSPEVPAQAVTGKTITATVNGLVCDFCAQSIKKTLMKQPGVADAKVDLTAKTVVVGFKSDKVMDEATLKSILKEAGYDLTAYKVN